MTPLEDRDEVWRNHIEALVAAAPSMTPDTVARLSALLNAQPDP